MFPSSGGTKKNEDNELFSLYRENASRSIYCTDIVGWVTGRAPNMCYLSLESLICNNYMKKWH